MRLELDWPHVMGFREGILCRHTEPFDKAVREGVALSIPFSFKDVQFPETIKSGGILVGSFHVVGVSVVCVAGNKATELVFISMYQCIKAGRFGIGKCT